jgi:anti-sigma regulatory factor (Ser/Thr protein kinase)
MEPSSPIPGPRWTIRAPADAPILTTYSTGRAYARPRRAGYECDRNRFLRVAAGKAWRMDTWRRRFRGGSKAVGSARTAVRERLRGELEETRLCDVELLVSELATNSLRHGDCRDGQVAVEAALTDDCVRLRLCDAGDGFEPGTPEPHPDGSGGWGLVLLDKLADRWGVQRNGGFCVWFEIQR